MFKKLFRSAIFNTWFSNVVTLFSSLIAIPIVITNLEVGEINIWFLFSSIVAMTQGVLFGFNGTFTRFVAYSFAGVRIAEFREISAKKNIQETTSMDSVEFTRIYFLMKKVYLVLSAFYFLLLLFIAKFALAGPMLELGSVNVGWLSWGIIMITTTFNLFLGYHRVFLAGINQVALVQRVLGIVNLVGLGLIMLVLLFYPTLLSIVFIYQLVNLAGTLMVTFFGRRQFLEIKDPLVKAKIDKELFSIVWDSAWKSGITTVLGNIIKHISAVLVAQLFVAAESASFLFTKRIFDIIERFTMATFQAKIPLIAKFRGNGDFNKLFPTLRKTQYISYGIFMFGYIIFILIGENLLSFVSSNVKLGSVSMIILFSFSSFISRWGGMSLSVSNQSNKVVEHLNIMVIAVAFFISIYLFYDVVGILVFPLSQIIAMIISMPLIAYLVYPTLHTNFISYEKRMMLPILALLILINSLFYYFTL
ncbi:MAG: hypothetical protein OCD76_15295 [Reichenbachiella sp.]